MTPFSPFQGLDVGSDLYLTSWVACEHASGMREVPSLPSFRGA